MNPGSQPIKSRRWRYGDFLRRALFLTALGAITGAANAACPPATTDGTTITRGEITLAWRPLQVDAFLKSGRIPMARHFALEVQLCDKNGVSTAQLVKADASMPAHKHGMNYRPTIKPLGNGRFRVDGMMFHMAGQWQLAFEVQAGKEITRLTHDVQAD
ncbi:MAG: FixH family protein [Rhodocyclales bacterium]|nr:FixH family protein [Rhodocyclales bacterium]